MTDENTDKRCDVLRFGKPREKLDLLRELEDTAKECRQRADKNLPACSTPAERESFHRLILYRFSNRWDQILEFFCQNWFLSK